MLLSRFRFHKLDFGGNIFQNYTFSSWALFLFHSCNLVLKSDTKSFFACFLPLLLMLLCEIGTLQDGDFSFSCNLGSKLILYTDNKNSSN